MEFLVCTCVQTLFTFRKNLKLNVDTKQQPLLKSIYKIYFVVTNKMLNKPQKDYELFNLF